MPTQAEPTRIASGCPTLPAWKGKPSELRRECERDEGLTLTGPDPLEAKVTQSLKPWFRDAALIAAALCIGWWAHGAKTVSAASDNLQFQLHGLDTANALLVYQPEKKTIYVYRSVMTGGSGLQCSYRFQLGEPGGVIRRELCPAQSLLP